MLEAVNSGHQTAGQSGIALREVQGVHDVLSSLVKAVKNYALFPPSHPTSRKLVTSVKERLDGFLSEYDFLRFDISKDAFLYHDAPINRGARELDELVLQLYRDGVQWIEFESGIELREISLFLKAINTYRHISQEEAEDDLVTALWSADLPHIHYEAADIFWEGEPLLDFAALAKPERDAAPTVSSGAGSGAGHSASAESAPSPPSGEATRDSLAEFLEALAPIEDAGPALYPISPAEQAILKRMVEQEEANDGKQDALNVLLVVLAGEDDRQSFLSDLEFVKEEFRSVLSAKDFAFALELLQKVYALFKESRQEKPWALPLLESFSREISSPRILDVLLPVLPVLDQLDKTQVKLLVKFLISLHPQAITTLCLMLPRVNSSRVLRLLVDIIAYMANRNIEPLVELLNHSDDDLVLKLVQVLRKINTQRSTGLLLDRMVHHRSERVRLEALQILVSRETRELSSLFHLVGDASSAVREQMFRYLGKSKSEKAEALMLNYINGLHGGEQDDEQIMSCYRVLGRCGSDRSLEFLREVLLGSPWNWFSGLGAYRHRMGAALALESLDTEEGQAVLSRAGNSVFPHIRRACRSAAGA